MCCFFCLFVQWNILYILHSEKLNRYYTGALLPAGYADYYPVGEKLPTRNSTVGYRSGFQGQEFDAETNMEAFRLRLWDGRIGRWLSPYPAGQYHSPYSGMGNNPIGMIDPDGGSTAVIEGPNGTYIVRGVDINDGDNGIYLIDKKTNTWNIKKSKKIGYSSTLYSFYNADLKRAELNAVINPKDVSGGDFLVNKIMNNTPSLIYYMKNGITNGEYDFKATNGEKIDKPKYTKVIDYYRGGLLSQHKDGLPIFASARDIGNIAAGYIAANYHINWGYARLAFDALETKQKQGLIKLSLFYPLNRESEGIGTQAGQLLGYEYYAKFNKE
jgi:RHS repeat-associated protein